jgi:hypothetical protein
VVEAGRDDLDRIEKTLPSFCCKTIPIILCLDESWLLRSQSGFKSYDEI